MSTQTKGAAPLSFLFSARLPATFAVLLIYNAIVFVPRLLGHGDSGVGWLEKVAFGPVRVPSGMISITFGTILLAIGLVTLFIEIVRATRTDAVADANQALSVLVLLICVVEFLLVPGFNTSVFLLIGIIALVDVVAGSIVTRACAKRDAGITFPPQS